MRMMRKWKLWFAVLLVTVCLNHVAYGHLDFTKEGCLAAHNQLRALHENTNDVVYDAVLETSAKSSAEFLQLSDATTNPRPSRPYPKRRRRKRHIDEDIDPNVHVESWSGDIYFPDPVTTKTVEYGESIHKFCCQSQPHCPKEFFHNLLFPPSAEGVVNDFYNQEIDGYDFAGGKKKSQYYTRIKHFTNIVWKKTTKIGCAQSAMSRGNCIYTVVHYKVEGSIGEPDAFKENVGNLKGAVSEESEVLTIFLIVFFIVLLISFLVLCYCCRDNLRSKQSDIKIKMDTMKAEQELETDSTSLWWTRAFKKKRPTANRPARAKSTKQHQSLRERPSIEVMPNTAPQRSIRMPPRIRGESNAQSFAIKYHGISKKAKHYVPGETIYENTTNALHSYDNSEYENHGFKQKPLPMSPVSEQPGHPRLDREPSLSGKPAPPPVPKNPPVPVARNSPMFPKLPVQQSPSWQKPQPTPVSRGPSNASSNKPTPLIKPILPPAPSSTPPINKPQPRPVPAVRRAPTNAAESPSVNELRNQFNQQLQSPSSNGRNTPPVKPKPIFPPPTRPR